MQRYIRQHVDGVRLLLQASPVTLTFYPLQQGSPSPAAREASLPLQQRRRSGYCPSPAAAEATHPLPGPPLPQGMSRGSVASPAAADGTLPLRIFPCVSGSAAELVLPLPAFPCRRGTAWTDGTSTCPPGNMYRHTTHSTTNCSAGLDPLDRSRAQTRCPRHVCRIMTRQAAFISMGSRATTIGSSNSPPTRRTCRQSLYSAQHTQP
jgi:hypothetical protein